MPTGILDAHVHYWPAGPGYDPREVERHQKLSCAAGIVRSVLLGSLGPAGAYPTPAQLRDINDQTMALVRAYPDTFSGLVYVNPTHAQNALDEINRCVRDGNLIGIKLWVSNRASDERVFPVAERALELDIGVLQHTWNKTVEQGADESTSRDVAELARRYPALRIQVAHLTGINFWGVRDLAPFPNVTVDTSGGQPQSGLVEYAVRLLGADRVVYGSDWPIRDLPCQIARVTGAEISRTDRNKILSQNAARFWKIALPDSTPSAAPAASPEIRAQPASEPITDPHAWFGPFPSQRHLPRTLDDLAADLAAAGITAAHLLPTEVLYGQEPAEDCLRLAGQLADHRAAHPNLPLHLHPALCLRADQPGDVRRLPELVNKTGARLLHLFPVLHGCPVDAPATLELVRFARQLGLLSAVHLRIFDRRCADPRLLTADLELKPLLALAQALAADKIPLLALSAFGPESRLLLKESTNLYCDIAQIESGSSLPDQCQEQPAETIYPRLLFGSHAPFLYPAPGVAKLANPCLAAPDRASIAHGNFTRLLATCRLAPATVPAAQ